MPPAPWTFEQVFDAHAAMVWRTVRHLGVAPSDIEDVCQEVFLVVHRKLPEFDVDGPAGLRTWLYAVCLNVVRNDRRRAHHQRERPTASPPEGTTEPLHEDALDRARAASRLQRRLATLDEDKRAVFLLHDLEGVPMKEITGAFGVPLQTGYSRLRAARQHLEAELAEERLRDG